MKKIIIGLAVIFAVSLVVRGDLMDKIQNIDSLIQKGKYDSAESAANRLLNDPNMTDQERASVQNLLSEIRKKKNGTQKQSTQQSTSSKHKEAQNILDNIISNAFNTDGTETDENQATEETATASSSDDTGTVPASTKDEASSAEKFQSYDNYEAAALKTKSGGTIFQMAQLYFKDGLYERAQNVAKKDTSGDIRNLYVVAVTSRLMGNYDQSIDYYNRILAVSPGQAEARLGIGIAYKSKGDFNKALEYLRSYAASNSNAEVNKAIKELNDIVASK